jgi:hypothetical protein
MTSDDSACDTVSADSALENTITSKNSVGRNPKTGIANCKSLAETTASSENAIIEQVARLAQRYAARAPTSAEFKALKAGFILETADSDKPINFRGENLARPLIMPSSQNPWVTLQAHVGGGVRPETKARSRAKRYIPMVLTLAFFMYFVGPVYLDEAYAPFLRDNAYRAAGSERPVVPTNANGDPIASSGNARAAFRLGCEAAWNVILRKQRCADDSLWDQPEELVGGYRFFDPRTAFSTLPDQYIPSWARATVSQNGATFQFPRSPAQGTDRQATAEASDRPKYNSLSASDEVSPSTAPSIPASEHPTVEQQHEASTKLGDGRLPSRANLVPMPQARPKTIDH